MDYKVSVYCLAYNHEKYIRKTLEGFVNQKTNFNYKVIVHDDASIDKTPDIIKEYAKKYPNIIFPIIQTTNQKSKGIDIMNSYILPMIEGEYVGICEGDDYWCHNGKLQMQFDYLESHSDCSACVHNTQLISEKGDELNRFFNKSKIEKDYNAYEVITAGSGGLFHFSSIMYRHKVRCAMPSDFEIKGIGDYPLAIWLSLNGMIHYFPEIMSKYRINAMGSWSASIQNNTQKRIQYYSNEVQGLKRMDEITSYGFHDAFAVVINRASVKLLLMKKSFMELISKPEYYSALYYVIHKNINKRIRNHRRKK